MGKGQSRIGFSNECNWRGDVVYVVRVDGRAVGSSDSIHGAKEIADIAARERGISR